MNDTAKPNPWIHSAKVDLIFFASAWLLLFGAYLAVDQTDFKLQGRQWLLYLTLLFTVFHRHLTFPLVYGDPEIFAARKKIYLTLPILLFVLTAASLLYVREPTGLTTAKERPLFLLLVLASALWNFWHTLMQKLGILRVYSRKAGYGKSWLDRSMVWVWFGCLFFALAASPEVRRQAVRLSSAGKILTHWLEPISFYLSYLALGFLVVGVALTVFYILQEFKHRDQFHWPKNIFLLSLWGIYLAFFYDFLVGYVAFGFSHAIEYLAFVGVFAQRKYAHRPLTSSWMARLVAHQGRNFSLFMLVSALIFVPWFWGSRMTLNWYIVATSFMHFLYDGWIWKVRRPEVGTALGIQYSTEATAA